MPGPQEDVSAVAYNLQYTHSLVAAFAQGNPPSDSELQMVRLRGRELARTNLYGGHPHDAAHRVCTIGIGDDPERARRAADSAWFDYHASVFFTSNLGDEHFHRVSIRRRVPGLSPNRAETVGVAYDVDFMRGAVEAAVARNTPTLDECHVIHSGEVTLMRVNLYGRDPLDSRRQVCVGGIADRHYRAMAAAEQAWTKYHASLLLAAGALSR